MTEFTTASSPIPAQPMVKFKDAFDTWVKVALYSFGGPAGQIAVMHRLLVEERRWVSENRFLHALNYTMLLPGPEAQQLAIYIGWLLHGYRGGLVAGTLFVLPGFLSILALSILYVGFQDLGIVAGLFYGLKPAVVALVVEAVLRIGRRALKNWIMAGIAVLSFIAIFFFDIPFPLIILTAGITGFIGGQVWPQKFLILTGHKPPSASTDALSAPIIPDYAEQSRRPSLGHSLKIVVIHLLLWFGPLLLLALWLGRDNIFVVEGLFFSQTAVVTFGGAYAVLAYIAQEAVYTFGWLHPGEMLDGLGLAETTPGPLIQVVQFVGFLGAYRHSGNLDPMVAGILASTLTTWVTFVPCFLWIFLGAPYIEYLRGNRNLTATLSTITAAVVGVVMNLAIWFSLHTLFTQVDEVHQFGMRLFVPNLPTIDPAATLITIGAFIALLYLHIGVFKVLAGSMLAGIFYYVLVMS